MGTRIDSTVVAGIDIGKAFVDAAVGGGGEEARFARDRAGLLALVAWLRERGVARVGLEASGGYEKMVVAALSEHGFEVVEHQPMEVRLYARLTRRRAKNDRLDARLIAEATCALDARSKAFDPSLAGLAERMTIYEQTADMLAQLHTQAEHITLPDLRAGHDALVRTVMARKAEVLRDILARIKAHKDLAARYALLMSLPGVGPVSAACLLIRMPELGSLEKGKASGLLGVAPYDHDSGAFKGMRRITGGRQRPRRTLYMAALAARRVDPDMADFAHRLANRGKAPKIILVAIMRKLVEAANLVLKRNTPWICSKPA